MKIKNIFALLLLLIFAISGCKKDQYDPPTSLFDGAVTYNGEAIGVSYNDVSFQLWQPGFGKLAPINVSVSQEGTFSSLLFDGDYKLIFQKGQGPFLMSTNSETNSDTILVNMKGNKNLNIEVLPYFLIKNPSYSITDGTVKVNFAVEKIITDSRAKNIDNVSLYLSKTRFVDQRTSVGTTTMAGNLVTNMSSVTLERKIPNLVPAQSYIFARIGLKIQSVEDMIFSPVVQLSF